jgi:hypothetical protein
MKQMGASTPINISKRSDLGAINTMLHFWCPKSVKNDMKTYHVVLLITNPKLPDTWKAVTLPLALLHSAK